MEKTTNYLEDALEVHSWKFKLHQLGEEEKASVHGASLQQGGENEGHHVGKNERSNLEIERERVIQWNLSIVVTLGTQKTGCYREVTC